MYREKAFRLIRPVEEGCDDLTYGTTSFKVLELDLNDNKWVKVKDLGNRALFLGYNSSFSIEVSVDSNRIKNNCIYFTDDCSESYLGILEFPNGGGKDMGIYNLLDGRIEPHFCGNSYSLVTPPTWVEPSFY